MKRTLHDFAFVPRADIAVLAGALHNEVEPGSPAIGSDRDRQLRSWAGVRALPFLPH